MALNNCEAATPARIVRSLPPRAPLVSKATKAKAAKAPAKAPAEREIAPAPRPSTTLDTARFKYALGEHLGVDPRNVHARIIGEHGDSEIAAWSLANISGIPLNDFCELRGHTDHQRNMDRIAEEVKNAAYEIIKKKRATYYGIAMTVKRICEAITRDEKPILPVSNYIDGEYGLHDIVLSMPAVVGASGIEYQVPIKINETETEQLKASAATLRSVIDKLDL